MVMTAAERWIEAILEKSDALEGEDTGEWSGSFYFGNKSGNVANGSQDGLSGVLFGQDGNDTIIIDRTDIGEGGNGNDTLVGVGGGVLGGHKEDGDDTMVFLNGGGLARGGAGRNRISLSEGNHRDTVEVFDIDGESGFNIVDNFGDEDKIGLILGTRDKKFTFTTGIQSPSDVGNFYQRGNTLMFQAEGESTANPVMRFVGGGVTLTADSFVGANIS